MGGPSSTDLIGGQIRNSEAAMGGEGGAQRPVWRGNELKKTGARSARARTRGQNPLVFKYPAVVMRFWFEILVSAN